MTLEKFSLASLAGMDSGRIHEAFTQAMRRCEEDCKDRPAVKAARKLTLTVTLKPIADPEGDLDSVDVGFKITDNVPKRESKEYNMTAGRDGLFFNELSADDAKQLTLDSAKNGPRAPSTSADAVHEAEEKKEARRAR